MPLEVEHQEFQRNLETLRQAYGKEPCNDLFLLITDRCGKQRKLIVRVLAVVSSFAPNLPVLDLKQHLDSFFTSALFTAHLHGIPADRAPFLEFALYHFLRFGMTLDEPVQYPSSLRSRFSLNPRMDLEALSRSFGNGPIAARDAGVRVSERFLRFVGFIQEQGCRLESLAPLTNIMIHFEGGDAREIPPFLILLEAHGFLAQRKNLDPQVTLEFLSTAMGQYKMPPSMLLDLIHDFLVDARYHRDIILPLFRMLMVSIATFFPARQALIPRLLVIFEEFVRISGSTSEKFLKIIFALFAANTGLDISPWVQEGARVLRIHGDQSASTAAFFSRESDFSRKLWGQVDTRITFDQVGRRLQFFAKGLSEKGVTVKAHSQATDEPDGMGYSTDGTTIYVPWVVNEVPDREQNFLYLLHSTAHECAHIEFGSYLQDETRYRKVSETLSRLFPGRERANQKLLEKFRAGIAAELTAEGYTVTRADHFPIEESFQARLMFQAPFPWLLKDFWNVLEDLRVDRLLYAAYQGFRQERQVIQAIDFGRAASLEEMLLARGLEGCLLQAFLNRVLHGRLKGSIPPAALPTLECLVGIADRFQAINGTDTYAAFEGAAELLVVFLGFLSGRGTGHLPRDADFSTFLGPGFRRNGRPVDFEREWIRGNLCRSPRNQQVEVRRGKRQHVEQFRFLNELLLGPPPLDLVIDETVPFFRYDEWNWERNCYREGHCALGEFGVWEVKGATATPLREEWKHLVEEVRRTFLRLRPGDCVIRTGMEDGFEVDFDRHADALLDLASGRHTDLGIYLQRELRKRSVAVSMVMDMSDSTRTMVEDRPIYEHQKAAVFLLSEAMQILGDPFGIFSFMDGGPGATFFFTIKEFDEPYGEKHYQRLCRFQPDPKTGAWSRFAVGLRHLIAKMKNRPEKTRMLFFITDGMPNYIAGVEDRGEFSQYIQVDNKPVLLDHPVRCVRTSWNDETYIYHDLRKVHEEAVLAGVRIFCITLDGHSLPFMQRVFGKSVVHLPRADMLPRRLIEIFRQVTT